MGVEVVIRRQDAGADELLLEGRDVVEEVFRGAAADVVDGVWRDREAVGAVLFLRCAAHDADDPFDDVVDVGEVALAVSVVEDLDAVTLHEAVGRGEVEHVGAAGRAVDGEEAEAGGRDVIELRVGVGHELVAFFRCGVEGDRVVDLVVGAERNLFVAAVDRGGRGVDEVLHRVVVACGLEEVVEADQVGVDVDVRVVDAVAHAGLGGEVDEDVEAVGREELVDERLVGDVTADEDPAGLRGLRGLLDLPEAILLQLERVVIGHAVDADDRRALRVAQQPRAEVRADEARRACDEDGFSV